MKKALLIIFLIVQTISVHASETPNQFVESFTNKIFITAQINGKSVSEVRDMLITEIKAHTDSNYISRFVLGKNWRKASKAQKQQFTKLYEDYLTLLYAPKFQGYGGEEYEIIETQDLGKQRYKTKLILVLADTTELNIELFFIKNKSNQYKIVDISGEGISFVAAQRDEFSSVISKNGFPRFLEIFEERVTNMKLAANN